MGSGAGPRTACSLLLVQENDSTRYCTCSDKLFGVVFAMLVVLVPCSQTKSLDPNELQISKVVSGLAGGTPEATANRWRALRAKMEIRTPVRDLYRGGAWKLALEAVDLTQERCPVDPYVVSAGLGLARFDEQAPGYDATFTPGSASSVPGSESPNGRARWWNLIGGELSLRDAIMRPDVRVVAALSRGYVDAVGRVLADLRRAAPERLVVLCCALTSSARDQLRDSAVRVEARKTRAAAGNAGQAPLSALRWLSERILRPEDWTPSSVRTLLEDMPVLDGPVYPSRQRMGDGHALEWLGRSLRSANPPKTASEALRRYRGEGFALEQRRFHGLFAATKAGLTCP